MKSNNIIKFLVVLTTIYSAGLFAQQNPGRAHETPSSGTIRLPAAPEPVLPADTVTKQLPVEDVAEGATTALVKTGEPSVQEQTVALPAAAGPEMVYLNVQDQEITDVIRQISKATGKNFIIDSKVKGKVTILSEKKMTKEEAYQAFLSALEVAGFTVVTGPAGLIKVVPLQSALSSPIPIHVDSTPYTDSFITRLISLSNISAVEMSNAIKGLISKNGNLFAYPATNTLILTDSGTNIDRLMKIIKELDQEGPQQVVEIISIQHADAEQISNTVLNLFELEKAKAGAAAPRKRGEAASQEEVEEVSKIIADKRTNSVIVLASKRSIDKIKDLIARLDTEIGGDTGTIHVHYLKYANAEEMAATLSSVTGGGGGAAAAPAAKGAEKGKTAGKTTESAIARFEGGMTIGADKITNALIITASPKDYQMLVDELISKLDVPRRQVYLESIVMELNINKNRSYGVSGYSGAGNGKVLGFGQSFGAASQLFSPASLFATGGLLGGVIGKDQITINVPVEGGGTQAITMPAFAAFLNLISQYSDANVISTPNILTIDNEEASIDVKRKEYASSSTTTATGVINTTPTPLEAGLTLKITPQISEGDAVRLKIEHELSNFEDAPPNAIARPTRTRKISTTVMAMDGQTVVLGGLMEEQEGHSKEKIPLLGDIPIIGVLFSQTRTSKYKSNLLVFITPHVIKDPSDFAEVMKSKLEQRNRFIDDNYGKRQARSIKDMITSHRADLLEYTPALTAVPQRNKPPATNISSAVPYSGGQKYQESSVEKPAVQAPQPQPPPQQPSQNFQQPSSSSYTNSPKSEPPKKIEGLDLAY